jgi:hypothetical protein
MEHVAHELGPVAGGAAQPDAARARLAGAVLEIRRAIPTVALRADLFETFLVESWVPADRTVRSLDVSGDRDFAP